MFFTVAIPIYIPTNCVGGVPFIGERLLKD